MTTFEDDFWPIAIHMRGRCRNPRGTAEAAWNKQIKAGHDPREIIAGLKGYLGAMLAIDQDMQFICRASTFLNEQSWDQYLDEAEARAYLAKPELRVVK